MGKSCKNHSPFLGSTPAAILSGLQTYYNHVRPYLGLPEGMTLDEVAGIHIEGDERLLIHSDTAAGWARVDAGADPSTD